MLNKTHIAIGILTMIIFLKHVVHKWIFVVVFLIATVLPNIDKFIFNSKGAFLFRPLKTFIHRDLIHSFTFCLIITLFLAFYWPLLAFPFFLGYALHLLADAWTVEGIRPFWPLKAVSKGKIEVGGAMEETVFMIFAVLDLIFALTYFL
ncbi:MAG: metal-dependent hydrolase [Candidatus Pacearchaeota archaeon]|nr:metal-dependent hydrolase [Candidatus Pacearchaeota archaeon]